MKLSKNGDVSYFWQKTGRRKGLCTKAPPPVYSTSTSVVGQKIPPKPPPGSHSCTCRDGGGGQSWWGEAGGAGAQVFHQVMTVLFYTVFTPTLLQPHPPHDHISPTPTQSVPTFTPCRSLLGSGGGTTASLVLMMGTMFMRSSSCSVLFRFCLLSSSWKSRFVTRIWAQWGGWVEGTRVIHAACELGILSQEF